MNPSLLYALIPLFALSVVFNGVLTFFLIRTPKAKKQLTYDAQALLKDLMTGSALLKVEYMDREEVFLRSPRHFS